MTPEYALSLVIRPVLSWMGSRYSSVDAERMMLAIGIQESGFQHRRQIVGIAEYGPARGWWQFERPGVAEALSDDRHDLVMRLGLPTDPDQLHSILQWSEVGATVCARLLLWGYPDPLPGPSYPDEGWRQYTARWRPGKPAPQRWGSAWERACKAVEGAKQ